MRAGWPWTRSESRSNARISSWLRWAVRPRGFPVDFTPATGFRRPSFHDLAGAEDAVVDEARLVEEGGDGEDGGAIDGGEVGELGGVAQLDVVDADERLGVERGAGGGDQRGGVALTGLEG